MVGVLGVDLDSRGSDGGSSTDPGRLTVGAPNVGQPKMERRTAGLLIGVLAVVCAGLLVSVVYPFTTAEPHAANPSGERFSVPDADTYSATGSIVVEGETLLAFDGAVAADGAWYERVVDDGVVAETYRSPEGVVYDRSTVEGGDAAEQVRASLAESEEVTLLQESREGDCVTFVSRRNATDGPGTVTGAASVFVNDLWVAAYEPTDTDSSGVTTYRPRADWYEGRVPYRVTAVSGTVRADRETGGVTAANVSLTVTEAPTYAHYVLAGVVGSGSTRSRTTFTFDATAPDLERPAWATDEAPEAGTTTSAC